MFFHEQLYRSQNTLERFRNFPIVVCGAGALGANLTENLARSGFAHLKVIDRDRVEERNLSTQPYYRSDIGGFKAKILANALYRAIGVKIIPETKELTAENAPSLLKDGGLIVDTFDNSISRQILKDYGDKTQRSCLHVGLAGDYGEMIWNSDYRVPSDVNDDVCDYPLARNLVLLAVAVACESIISFITTEETRSFTITLKDLTVRKFAP